jgi:predicted NBD/HSP70 family sugar kinase
MSGGSRNVGSLESLRDSNRSRVIDALRRRGSASRSDLARLTGLSRTTVTTLVADLHTRGLIVEESKGPAHAQTGSRGRRPAFLRLAPSAGAALGIDFGHRLIRVAVADLGSTVLAEQTIELDVDAAACAAMEAASELTEVVLAAAQIQRSQIIGAGVGIPGPIDHATGAVASMTILPGWSGVSAGRELERLLEIPVRVDNDANLGALGEVTYGAGQGLSDVIYVRLTSGIGSGLILGGRLHHGANGFAGELGHVQVQADGVVCRCGNRGCLETVAADGSLLALLRPAHGDDLTVRGMLELVASGDLGARRVFNDAGRALGRVLADLCNHLNPAAIIVGGELSAAVGPLLDGIRESVHRYAQPSVADAVEVKPGVLGDRAEVLGALALVIGDTDRLNSADIAALPDPIGERTA